MDSLSAAASEQPNEVAPKEGGEGITVAVSTRCCFFCEKKYSFSLFISLNRCECDQWEFRMRKRNELAGRLTHSSMQSPRWTARVCLYCLLFLPISSLF